MNLSNLYTASTIQAAYGISGIGNMFKPGVLTGLSAQSGGSAYAPPISAFQALSSTTEYHIPKSGDPDIGSRGGSGWGYILGPIFGKQAGWTVLRAGNPIATIREAISMLSSLYGGNPGLTYPASVTP